MAGLPWRKWGPEASQWHPQDEGKASPGSVAFLPASLIPSCTLCFPLCGQQCPTLVPLCLALLLLFISLHIHCNLFGSECDKLHIWAFLKSQIFVESNT